MVRQIPDDAHYPALTVAVTDQQVAMENAAADYLRGYCDGHEQGIAAGQAIEAVVRQLQAAAWDEGYDAGHADGIAEWRADVTRAVTP